MKIGTALFVNLALAACALAGPTPAAGSVHVRGTIKSLQGGVLTVQTATGPIRVELPVKAPVVSVIPSSRAAIHDGSYLGIASVPGSAGAQVAREVVVFPEAARGTGEGSYPWDLPGASGSRTRSLMTNGTVQRSTMTNGTVHRSTMTNGTVRAGGGGSSLTLAYKSGKGGATQSIHLTPGIPVVTFAPGVRSQLRPGAHVIVFAHVGPGGTTVADRTLVGKNGLVPPM